MLMRLVTVGAALTAVVAAIPTQRRSAWPFAPFKTSGRDIVDTNGDKVLYAGTNWPGHNDVMIPEGLQYQSIESIVSMIKSLGMNVVRLTYAIEMVDDIFSNKNSTLSAALDNALGSVNGSIVLQQILSHNPSFTASTTRLEVYDAVTAECYKQQLLVHLDNHVSKGEWCCSTGDGNAWFGSEFFNVENWRRGNAFMANHAKSWPAYVSQGLRNELRDPNNTALNYGWESWYQNVIPTADAVNAANPDPLIFYSGLHFDTDLANVTAGIPLTPDGSVFDISDFCYADKIVFELHNYNNALADANCANFNLTKSGYNAMDISSTSTAKNFAPVVLTEFGFPQTPTNYTLPYAQCIKEYLTTALPGGPGGWIHWAVGGSYYIREGVQDNDETWGLLNHDWSAWRSPAAVENYFLPFVQATLGEESYGYSS
ncbi:glycoside hydrolase family 5 protein [Sphaerulina musiva SO2202]|uniref:Glycoside hydrolase family 5 protein n=1 Tax=Sphaerulina musiva (strain SO2202) TaxID=692275 RepID=N1QEF6_SPHMS|nr:glycoside hydrolase family 5 protein [Sphaerulina musiva SO2202]EMF10750.1 glycoside hydrolase family 5 protein [Sphaerulina musiva SO2202]